MKGLNSFIRLLPVFLLVTACDRMGPDRPGTIVAKEGLPASPSGIGRPDTAPVSDASPAGHSLEWARSGALKELAAKDPDAALALIMAMPLSSTRDDAFITALTVIAKHDPVRARRVFNGWDSLAIYPWTGGAAEVAAALATVKPALAEAFLTSDFPPVRRAWVWRNMAEQMDPAVAASFYHLIPDGEFRLATAGHLVRRWTEKDPVAAAAWFDGVVAGLDPLEIKAFSGFGEASITIGQRRPDVPGRPEVLAGARLAYESARQPMARQLLARHYLAVVARNHPEQLVDLTAAIEAETAGISTSVAKRQMYEDPAGYAAALTPEEIKVLPPQSMESLCLAWGSTDPPAAAAWFSRQGKLELLYHPMRTWFSVNPDPAAAFLLTLPPGEVRDSIAHEFSSAAAKEGKPALVKSLLQVIQDPDTRAWAEKRVEDIQQGNR